MLVQRFTPITRIISCCLMVERAVLVRDALREYNGKMQSSQHLLEFDALICTHFARTD